MISLAAEITFWAFIVTVYNPTGGEEQLQVHTETRSGCEVLQALYVEAGNAVIDKGCHRYTKMFEDGEKI